ncbi:MAG: methylated-DNA-[protein]-cysteine S-methyltransferase [Thermoproteota archaeon]|jgi:methylated-DNA-[protein]-cysteine S-methyltransferase
MAKHFAIKTSPFSLGDKNLSRIVGTLCNKNPIPFIIPCNRIKAKHSLGGFAYGELLKQQLLTHEGSF